MAAESPSGGRFAAYDALPIGVLVSHRGALSYANRAASEIIGSDLSKRLGAAIAQLTEELISEQQRSWIHAIEQSIQRGEATPPEIWVNLSSPSGAIRHVRALRFPDPGREETMVLLFDSETEAATQRLTEAMVQAAVEFVRCRDEAEVIEAAVESIHRQGYYVALMVFRDGKLTSGAVRQDPGVLKSASELLGFSPLQFTWEPDKLPYLKQLFAGRRAIFTQDIFSVMDTAHPPAVAKMLRESLPPLRMVDSPIFLEDEPFGFFSVQGMQLNPGSAATVELFCQLIAGALENVRHHRRAEARLEELTRLQQELVSRERLAALGEAAGVLSHEARNPLGAILNSLAVLRRNPGLGEGGRQVLEIAEEEAFRLDALVRDLMELARPLEPRIRPLQLPALLDAAISDLRRRMGSSLPPFEITAAPGIPEVHADPTLLRVAIENLVRNAAQIAAGSAIRVILGHEEEHVLFGVDDALPPSDRANGDDAFDPFSVVRPRGTGLGLAVVKRVIEAQGGSVRARNGGARIELRLPKA